MDYFKIMHSKARRLDVDLFVRASPGMYLLGVLPSTLHDDPMRRSFTTLPPFSVADLEAAAAEQNLRDRTQGRFLCKVEKTDKNPFQNRISLGRAKNNDMVIEHPSVSKLHAHILIDDPETLRLLASPLLQIQDAGSRNGTLINGHPLSALKAVPLPPGARLLFGDVICDLLSAASLHRIMRTQFPSA